MRSSMSCSRVARAGKDSDGAWAQAHAARRMNTTLDARFMTLPKRLPRWLDPQQGARFLVRQHIQQSIRALAHVADPLSKFGQQRLAAQFFHLLVKQDALEMAGPRNLTGAQRAHKHIALPLRETVTSVEGHARERNRGHPVHHGRLEAFMPGTLGLPGPLVGTSQAYQGPAIIAAGLENVDLVAAVGAILVLPHLAG